MGEAKARHKSYDKWLKDLDEETKIQAATATKLHSSLLEGSRCWAAFFLRYALRNFILSSLFEQIKLGISIRTNDRVG